MERQGVVKMLFFCGGSLVLAGCTLDVSIESLNPSVVNPPEVLKTEVTDREITPASQQGVVTSGGYQVQSSVGFHGGAQEVVTTQGYKVKTSFQSTLFKE